MRSCQFKVCVAESGLHTNIIVPVKNEVFDWRHYLSLNADDRYLGFGWGDRSWYVNPPTQWYVKITKGLRALFFPNNPAVIRVQTHGIFPQFYQVECVGVERQDYLELMHYIRDYFQFNAGGGKVLVAENSQINTWFYEAKGNYSIMRNSNDWTAIGLRLTDMNTPVYSGLSGAIMWHLQGNC